MAVDGVAPRAKMNQQRARRFMSAKNSQDALQKAMNKGVPIPNEKPFDSNCITPGLCNIALASVLFCPGEGEHKIMDFIRSERSQPNYDPNTRHCLYGLDADLVIFDICENWSGEIVFLRTDYDLLDLDNVGDVFA
ncbi:unnamed protein product [Gongylonema pulchrum]|uniref:XRN_N domain-containing protein n=1 Tax=Gongylonema pulchrum TaxID=637853 RepID=A0A183ET47_9BILA|nr:unnamed protein product [Gongylonema pulchrum]